MNGPAFSLTIDDAAAGRRCRLTGRVTLADGRALWRDLGAAVAAGATVIDLAGVDRLDGGAAALLVALANAPGVSIEGAQGDVARLLRLYACPPGTVSARPVPRRRGTFAQIGDATVELLRELQRTLAFLGDLTLGLVAALQRPRTLHLADLPYLAERAGADGLPIVAVINFLVGLILALQGSIQLHRFGADTFIANLVGLSVVRELAPLMTAIVVAGRSGAAYAAELGTMTVNEEVDALRTIGQDPQRFLVFPRVLALAVAVPLLTILADVLGCLGGAFIALNKLAIPPQAYFNQLQRALELSDVLTGLIKSVAFAVLIGLVACQRGLSSRGGAQGVGASTTSAVVVVLFGLVVLDAVFTLIFTLLHW